MNKLYYLTFIFFILIIIFLLNSIFFSENSYSKRNELIEENSIQKAKNADIKKHNTVLEFEINNAQNSYDHVENFAREKLNLTYPDEEFISFKNEDTQDNE
jgi:cell division protein FtsB